ncbi:PEGA domain-containing protein [Pendulispora rubella]|uniref:PEGA domain-containing protein n=1 Tax=Pendulispora rubella TaxID=2741070 RepID=A0ABZ2L3Q1_9BACT
MRLAYVWLLATTILVFVSLFTRSAQAQGARSGLPLHVLPLDSEDADEQAEALGVALRSRAREKLSPVADTSPSLGMLLAALRCPSRPDTTCLQKIADQLKTDRFIYGHVSKMGPSARGQLTAEIHLFVRGKPDASVKEVFSDNLKDQNDEYLRRMAARIVDRLTGTAPQNATITLRAGRADGEVWVDGTEKGRLENGRASLDLAAGRHVIEVRASGYATARKEVTVVGGVDADVVVPLAVESETAPSSTEGGGSNTRAIAGWALVGVGAVAGGFAIYEGVHFLSLKSETEDFRDAHQIDGQKPSKEAICQAGRGEPAPWAGSDAGAAQGICDNYDSAKTASLLGLVGGAVAAVSIGVGTYLLLTDTSTKKDAPTSARAPRPPRRASLQFLPHFAPREGGMRAGFDVRVVF